MIDIKVESKRKTGFFPQQCSSLSTTQEHTKNSSQEAEVERSSLPCGGTILALHFKLRSKLSSSLLKNTYIHLQCPQFTQFMLSLYHMESFPPIYLVLLIKLVSVESYSDLIAERNKGIQDHSWLQKDPNDVFSNKQQNTVTGICQL